MSAITPGPDGAEVTWHDGDRDRSVTGAACCPASRRGCCASCSARARTPTTKPDGSQLKINFLLDRLPALRSGADPAVAFAGTLHLDEDYTQLEQAYAAAAGGSVPDPLPGEVYCHSLSDPSILGDRAGSAHTLTYFGLHTPAALFDADPSAPRRSPSSARSPRSTRSGRAHRRLPGPDADGDPCIEAKIPQDVETDLAMPGGHIFHGDLDWPWAPNRARLDTPAQQWGVQTGHDSVLLCGSGARRGGAVSGLGGHNAAQAVLAELWRPPRFRLPSTRRVSVLLASPRCAISSIGRAADS